MGHSKLVKKQQQFFALFLQQIQALSLSYLLNTCNLCNFFPRLAQLHVLVNSDTIAAICNIGNICIACIEVAYNFKFS